MRNKIENKIEPYVGPRPFEKEDIKLFFGRDSEVNELFSLVVSNDVVLVYGQSGSGKTSLFNARLIPLLDQKGFEVLPVARVGGLIPEDINKHEKSANSYVFSTPSSWAGKKVDPSRLSRMTIAGFLREGERSTDEGGEPKPRVVIFDQFEELFFLHPEYRESRRYREGFFEQIRDALIGNPLVFRVCDLKDPTSLIAKLCDTRDLLSQYIRKQFSGNMQSFLDSSIPIPLSEKYQSTLLNELNELIRSDSLYDKKHFAHVKLTKRTEDLIKKKPRSKDLMLLNRLLLEEAYPNEIAKSVEGDRFLRVVFVIREDYLAQIDRYDYLLPEKLRTRFHLEPLRKEAALSAVTDPLKGTGRSFHKGVAEELVKGLLTARSEITDAEVDLEFIEPLQLQVVCQSSWRDLPPDAVTITKDNLKIFTDVNEALSNFYERSLETVTEKTGVNEEELREWIKQRLITPRGTRESIWEPKKTGEISNTVIDELENLHLIRAEWRAGGQWYELIHDRFIKPIQESNQKWLTKRWRAEKILSKPKLHDWLKVRARSISHSRKLLKLKENPSPLDNLFPDLEAEKKDFSDACTYWASEILAGEKKFAYIDPASYHHLEDVWLRDVKKLKAYLNWEREGGDAESNYYETCEQIRNRLMNKSIKAFKNDFEKVKDYLKSCYLATDGTIDEEKPKCKCLIKLKEKRVKEMTGKSYDPKENSRGAERYVKRFYENIVPAVEKDEPKWVTRVIDAFRLSKAPENRYLIINCFETALTIYFLNPTTIRNCSKNIKEIL